MSKNSFLEAARKYEKPMVRFLRDLVAIPSESAEEGPVIERIRKETGWPLAISPSVHQTERPSAEVLRIIREYDREGFWTRRGE